MAQKRKPQRSGKTSEQDGIPVLNPNTAGLDIGANEIYAAVPIDRDPEPVKSFGTLPQS